MSYFVIFISQLAIVGGTLSYTNNDVYGSLLSIIHCGMFFFVLIAYEITFRVLHRKPVPFRKHQFDITFEQFY